MKIQFLNTDCTEAVVTRGWFRPRSTHIHLIDASVEAAYRWKFTASGRSVIDVDYQLAIELRDARRKTLREAADERDWTDSGRFPKARLVKS